MCSSDLSYADDILIENCDIDATNGIGGSYRIGVKNITIKDTKYSGGTIGTTYDFTRSAADNSVETITIQNSDISAHASLQAAGIGSGPYGTVKKISIENSTVEARGADGGAGIGTGGLPIDGVEVGLSGDLEEVSIVNSTVEAYGEAGGAGIGSGRFTRQETIYIKDSTVIASGEDDDEYAELFGYTYQLGGAGIGAGWAESSTSITIEGGTVTATGGYDSAAIGSSGCSGPYDGDNDFGLVRLMKDAEYCDIAIDGASVEATGGYAAAGIGGGAYADHKGKDSAIRIKDGIVASRGGTDGAGIGGGYHGTTVKDITIEGKSQVEAYGTHSAAGIGGGKQSGASQVGTVTVDCETNEALDYYVYAYGADGV